jgi:hypothetical protein
VEELPAKVIYPKCQFLKRPPPPAALLFPYMPVAEDQTISWKKN